MLATHTVTNSAWLRNSIASETKTGNNTAVNRPTPSKPFGNDSAIEMSAHAVSPTPSVRAAADGQHDRRREHAQGTGTQAMCASAQIP